MDEANTRLSYEQSALPQAFADLDGRFISVNQTLSRLLGQPEGRLLGRGVASVLHPMESRDIESHFDRVRRGETRSAEFEVVARRADGRSLPLLVDATVVYGPDGEARAVALMAQDLTAVRSAEERLAGQERLFRALGHHGADAALVTDVDLVVTFASPAATRMLDMDQAELLSIEATDLVQENDRPGLAALVTEVVEGGGSTGHLLVRVPAGEGAWRWAELTVVDCLADPDVGGLILNLRDVTAELEAHQALQESEARYRAIVETAHEGILAVDASGAVMLANDRLSEILGLDPAELDLTGWIRDLLADAANGDVEGPTDGKVLRRAKGYVHPDGKERVLSVSTTPLPRAGGEAGTLMMVSDVTEAHVLQERLRHQALHDHLTGLANRYLFEDRLEMAVARQQRHPEEATAVMYVDLDGFKEVNDTFGHAAGDEVLTEVGRRLIDAVRAADTVARLGGDEFAIVCEGLDEEAARRVAQRIQMLVFRGLEYDGHPLAVGASIGIAMFPPHDPARALALADSAMYEAKGRAGGGVIVFGAASPGQ